MQASLGELAATASLGQHDRPKQTTTITAMICSVQQENSLQQFSFEDQITKSNLINKNSL
jgi:hypothetical protein